MYIHTHVHVYVYIHISVYMYIYLLKVFCRFCDFVGQLPFARRQYVRIDIHQRNDNMNTHILFHVLGRYHEFQRIKSKYIPRKVIKINRTSRFGHNDHFSQDCILHFLYLLLNILAFCHLPSFPSGKHTLITTQGIPYDPKSIMNMFESKINGSSVILAFASTDNTSEIINPQKLSKPTDLDILHVNILYCGGINR